MNMHPQGGVANGGQQPNAGVDVCKQHLDVCLGTEHQRMANDADGWDVLTAKFKAAGVDLVVPEATGGCERGLSCLVAFHTSLLPCRITLTLERHRFSMVNWAVFP